MDYNIYCLGKDSSGFFSLSDLENMPYPKINYYISLANKRTQEEQKAANNGI